MANVPSKVANRLVAGIKRFQPVLLAAKSRDIGESDTVTIVVDMLAEIFGYDKFVEITSEYAIRGTFCDLATKIDGALQSLIEVKAIGLELKEAFVKQAVDYAANQGVDWVVLTNAISWRVYKVTFAKPIGQELVIDIDFCSLNPKNAKDIESLYLFCKEGWIKSVLGEYHREKEALSRFFLGAVVLSDPVLQVIRKELKKASPDVRIDVDKIKAVLTSEVLKREVMEGDKANEARKKVAKAASKALKTKGPQKQADQQPEPAVSSLPEEPSGHPISPESEV
jgi:hypothetical protein